MSTKLDITKAEKQGGMVYENGWVIKPEWNWKSPYGIKGHPDEPAVPHITFDEAQAYCIWKDKDFLYAMRIKLCIY